MGAPRSGSRRIGRYKLVRLLGTGSFGAVYLANDPALDSPVAVKVLADHHSEVPDLRERFVREARLLRRLRTDRVVEVYDIGEADGQPYFVMEAFEEGTLEDRMAVLAAIDGAPSLTSIRRAVGELAACLADVHASGVVHRDVKPSNVLIRSALTNAERATTELLAVGERFVLGDFGLARDATMSNMTLGVGTDGFTAPEQRVPSYAVDHRADIYAASAVIGSLASGRAAVDNVTVEGLEPLLHRELAKGMSVEPADRHHDIVAWGRSVCEALDASDDIEPVETRRASSDGADPRNRKVLLGSLAAVFVLVLAVASVLLWPSDPLVSDSDGPSIEGPTELFVGESATFTHEADPEATYVWRDAAGNEYFDASIGVTPRSSGEYSLTLTRSIDGESSTTVRTVTIAER